MISRRQPQRRRRAAHILLHQPHGAGRFQIQTTAIETNALADQRHFGMVRIAPAQIQQARRVNAGAAHRMNQRKIAR
jgi:hypothetical protein